MEEFEYQDKIEQPIQGGGSDLFSTLWEFLIKFFKEPVTTLQGGELEFRNAAVLLGLLPFALFLAVWSLVNSFITSAANALVYFGPAAQIRSEMMAEISWAGIFGDGLLTIAVWFALMMFAPVLIVRIFKNTESVDLKMLFTRTTILTIPMTLLLLVAAIFGFVGIGWWLLPVTVALVIPLLLHFFIIYETFGEDVDKTLYIVFATQVIIVIVVALWLNLQMIDLATNILGGMF